MSDDTQTTPRVRRRKVVTMDTATVSKAFPILKAQETRQEVDEFSGGFSVGGGAGEHTIVEPAYPPQVLNRHAMASGVLRTCIDAMATNIEGFGFTLEYIGEEGGQDSAEAQEEYNRARGVLDHPNGEYSLIELRKRTRVDKEAAGYCAIELVRNEDDGFPDLMYHVPSFTLRMTTPDRSAVESLRYLPRPGAQADNMLKVRKRFRRYVQRVNGELTYFRENGDVRQINHETGAPLAEGSDNAGKAATDIVFDYIYAPGSRYGAPRWVGDLRSVLGIQESENVNLGFFKDNGIPAMMLFALGGALTEEGLDAFERGIKSHKGQGMHNKISLVEVEGDARSASEEGVINRPDVKVVPLVNQRQTDAFFQQYEMNSAKKVRAAFRLPAMFTGLTEEVRYAVAEASLTVAENQVFGPERAAVDDMFNYQILTYNGQPMRYWRFRSNPPRITSEEAVMNAIDTFDQVGAMTPNIAIGLANEMFDLQIPLVEDGWGDQPFELTVAAQSAALSPDAPPEGPGDPEGQGSAQRAAPARVRRRKRMVDHRDGDRIPGTALKTLRRGPRIRRRRKVDDPTSDRNAGGSRADGQAPVMEEVENHADD